MCTVTVIPTADGVRLACNRDELRSRPAALPPALATFGPQRALLPVDPVSGGTWIAVSDAGLIVALLNRNAGTTRQRNTAPRRSRGAIIPALLRCGSLQEALEQALALEAAAFAPFRLVLVDRRVLAEVVSDGAAVHQPVQPAALAAPRLFTSSGLGDELVAGPRAALFVALFTDAARWAAAQDAFHRHQWPESPHLSVRMSRAEARTVSHTCITLRSKQADLSYRADTPDQCEALYTTSLPLREGGTS